MNAGLVANLAVTTAVQAGVGTIIAVIIRRYVAAVDKLADRVKQLEEKRIKELEASVKENRAEHAEITRQLTERMSRDEQRDLVERIEAVSDQQTATMIQQTKTATQMTMATQQIEELFGRISKVSTDVARIQGRSDAQDLNRLHGKNGG